MLSLPCDGLRSPSAFVLPVPARFGTNMSVLREWLHVWVWYWRHVTHRFARIDAYRLRGWLPNSCVCIDLGAHAGMWSVQLSRLVPHGQVVAFEALPYHARVLRRTLWLLGCRNVEVVNLAICDQAKSINLVWKNAHGKRLTGLTHILGQGETNSSTVTVQGTTLDDYFSTRPGRIRFVKMDIEGAEFAALQGAQQVVLTASPDRLYGTSGLALRPIRLCSRGCFPIL